VCQFTLINKLGRDTCFSYKYPYYYYLAARLGSPLLISIGIVLIAVLFLLVSLNVVKKHFYPIILYLISLSLLLGTTLTSNFLIGSDIHIEYYFARLTQLQGWGYSLAYNMNGALSVTLLAPFLSNL